MSLSEDLNILIILCLLIIKKQPKYLNPIMRNELVRSISPTGLGDRR